MSTQGVRIYEKGTGDSEQAYLVVPLGDAELHLTVAERVQRQNLWIAASESVCCNASPQQAQGPPRQH